MSTLMALATEPPDPPVKAGPLASVLTGLLRHEPAARLTAIEVDRRLRTVVAARNAPSVPGPRRAPESPAATPVAAKAAEIASKASEAAAPVPAPRMPIGSIDLAEANRKSQESLGSPTSLTGRRRRPLVLVATLVALVLLGGTAITGYLMSRNNRPTASEAAPGGAAAGLTPSPTPSGPAASPTAGFTQAVCAGPMPADAPTAPQPGAVTSTGGIALPGGWSYFAAAGFHLPVPDGWQVMRIGTTYCFRDTSDNRVLVLDTGRKITADPVQACLKEEARLRNSGALPGYHRLSIAKKPLLAQAADWEYQYTDPEGVPLHARTRWFVDGGRGFAISWATREIDWTADTAKLNLLLSGFSVDK